MCFYSKQTYWGYWFFIPVDNCTAKKAKPKIPSETCRELPIDPVGFCQPICLGTFCDPRKLGETWLIPHQFWQLATHHFLSFMAAAQKKKHHLEMKPSFPLPGDFSSIPKSQINPPPLKPSKKKHPASPRQREGGVNFFKIRYNKPKLKFVTGGKWVVFFWWRGVKFDADQSTV